MTALPGRQPIVAAAPETIEELRALAHAIKRGEARLS